MVTTSQWIRPSSRRCLSLADAGRGGAPGHAGHCGHGGISGHVGQTRGGSHLAAQSRKLWPAQRASSATSGEGALAIPRAAARGLELEDCMSDRPIPSATSDSCTSTVHICVCVCIYIYIYIYIHVYMNNAN